MNQKAGWKWAWIAVVMLVCVGMAGYVRSEVFQSPSELLKGAALQVTGVLLSRFAEAEIAGADKSLEDVVVARKIGAAVPVPAENRPVQAAARVVVEEEPKEATAAPVSVGEDEETPAPRKRALIYHSHNRESWLPELVGTGKDKANEAFDANVNVTLLGKRMRNALEASGIGAVHSEKDYQTAISSFNYNYSYKYSLKTVREAMAVNDELVYLFDLHRDAQRREATTVTIGGVEYAKLFFIIGQGNPDWKKNQQFAQRIHDALTEKLPGISKGILTKGSKHGHGEYNQSLSPGSVLVEVGGVDNTLEESYRTIDVLAETIAELIREAEAVDAPQAGANAKAAG